MKLKKTFAFAFWCSSIISLFILSALFCIDFLSKQSINAFTIILITIVLFIFSFTIIQLRLKIFIYRRIKKLFEEISLFDVIDLNKSSITTDVDSLSVEMKKFAEKKQFEITSLTEKETYRREFLGNVSHELKTPIFTIQGYLMTLLDGAIEDKGIRNKYLQRANKGVERLAAIVKDLDMISKLETNELTLNIEQFSIVDLIQDVFDLLEMRSHNRGITLKFDKNYDVPILVLGDIERIEQVLINIIVNSLKYGEFGGHTTVSIENYQSINILVKIVDDGEGIQDEHISRLFERFYRVDQSRSREQGGSGLGLSIVKHIIEAHNEAIFVTSQLGKGSEFSFTLKKVL